MISRIAGFYTRVLQRLDSAPEVARAGRIVSALALGLVSAAFGYGLYLTYPPTSIGDYALKMMVACLPLMAVMTLKRSGWTRWYRIPALWFIWFVTDTFAVALMMMLSMVWVWWRVLLTDNTAWRYARKTTEGA